MHPNVFDDQIELDNRLGIMLLRHVDDAIGLKLWMVAGSILIHMLKLSRHLR
jgi:hypothetical protein